MFLTFLNNHIWLIYACGVYARFLKSMACSGLSTDLCLLLLQLLTVALSSENDTQQKSRNGTHDIDVTRNKIVNAQFECYQKITKDTSRNRKGKEYKRTFQSC